MKITSDISANVLKCDVAGCEARFFSYSEHAIIREQAKIQHWARRGATLLGVTDIRFADLCPEHAAKLRSDAKRLREEGRALAKKERDAAKAQKQDETRRQKKVKALKR